MKITFNELGVLIDTITDDESYRQGNVGNTLTAVFEGKNANEHIATIVYTRPDGSKIARLPLTLIGSDSYRYTFNDAWFMAISGIATLTIYLHDSKGNIVANGQVQFNIEKTDTTDITTITPDELSEWIKQLANKVDINSTGYIHVKNLTDINIDEIANDTIIATINNNAEIEFYKNNGGFLSNISKLIYLDYEVGTSSFDFSQLYYGTIRTPNNLISTGSTYIGWRAENTYYFISNGKIYTTDANLTSGYVTINEEIANKVTRLTNLLVDENMQVRGQIYKGMGTPTENEEVLNRGEIKEEFVEQVKTGTAPRVYGVDSNDEQVMYEVRNLTVPNSIIQRNANGQAYIVTPTQPAHIANKGYVDGEITTLRDESMNYTDDEVTGAIAGLKDESGKIRSDLLPSYVDDVVEYSNRSAFPTMGEKGKIYVDTSTNESYRWSGTQYIELMSGDYYLRANGEKLELDLENLEKVTPTDIVADGNTIKLYHDSNEITGQENPIIFKTINGESIIGDDDIKISGGSVSTYNYVISPETAVVGTLTSEIVTSLSDTNATITRTGELYRYSDKSDSEYLTYVHASIDTSQSAKPAVMRAIRINLTTYAWELLDYELSSDSNSDLFVTKEELFEIGKNLYNPNKITLGYYLKDVGTSNYGKVKSELVANDTFAVSDWIKVEVGQSYIFSWNGARTALKIHFCDNDETVIQMSSPFYYRTAFTIPDGCTQIRFSSKIEILQNTTFQLEKGDTVTTYEPYSYVIKESYIKPNFTGVEEYEPLVEMVDNKIAGIDTSGTGDLLTHGKNLFNFEAIKVGEILPDTKGNNSTIISEKYSVSDFIKVEDGKSYIISYTNPSADYAFRMHYYDNEGNSIGFVSIKKNVAFTTLEGTTQLRISNLTTVMQSGTLQLEKGDMVTAFEPYTKTIKQEYLRADYTWYGKKAIFNGDSILELPYNWGKQMCEALGMIYRENKAIGGSTLAEYGNDGEAPKDRTPLISRYTQMTTDADIIFISIGTNDWAYTWDDIGEDTDQINTTFKGALHMMIKDMLDIYIGKVIVFVTPIKRNTPNDTNGFGKTLEDYANAIMDVCGQYGIPVIDMFHTCPLNPSITTQQAKFFDGNRNIEDNTGYANLYNDQTHPNYHGSKIQARCAIGFMKALHIFN